MHKTRVPSLSRRPAIRPADRDGEEERGVLDLSADHGHGRGRRDPRHRGRDSSEQGKTHQIDGLFLGEDWGAKGQNVREICVFGQVKHLKVWVFECRDPSYQAFKLGVAACVLLALAHAIGNLMGGCVCIWSKEDLNSVTANKQLAVASLIFSWYFLFSVFFFEKLSS